MSEKNNIHVSLREKNCRKLIPSIIHSYMSSKNFSCQFHFVEGGFSLIPSCFVFLVGRCTQFSVLCAAFSKVSFIMPLQSAHKAMFPFSFA